MSPSSTLNKVLLPYQYTMTLLLTITFLLLTACRTSALNNRLALRPPMGWLAWERFVCETNCEAYPDACISEKLFADMADRLVDDGFAQAGYTYVNIDDCWSKRTRNPDLKLDADPDRFPRGIRALADYMHDKNLKLGLYGDCGTATCQMFPGQLNDSNSLEGNYFDIDSKRFALDWHIDSFKFDACNVNVSLSHKLCPGFEDAFNKTGRHVLFACSWPAYENDANLETDFELVRSKCNLWRAFGDIEDSWTSVLGTIDWFVRKQSLIAKYHGPDGWFDADQLVIGNFGLSPSQERAQMAIWCMWSSPLYMSNDLRSLNKESSKLLRNKWLIEVNQDEDGVFGLMVGTLYDHIQAFIKPVQPIIEDCPSYAIAYLNRATLGDSKLATFRISELTSSLHKQLNDADHERFGKWAKCGGSRRQSATFTVHDLIEDNAKLDLRPTESDYLQLLVEPSGVRMVKLVQAN